MAKAWCICLSARCLPTKNLARVEYNRLRYIYAIRRGHNIDLGKMIVNSLDTITQNYYSGGVGMVGIITQICQMNGVTGHPTDVFMTCGRQVVPNTLERFSIRPRPQNEITVRELG